MDNKIEIPIHKQVCKKQSTRLHFFWFLFVSGITGPLFLLLVAGLFYQHSTTQSKFHIGPLRLSARCSPFTGP